MTSQKYFKILQKYEKINDSELRKTVRKKIIKDIFTFDKLKIIKLWKTQDQLRKSEVGTSIRA